MTGRHGFTLREAAERLSLGPSTLRRHIAAGHLRASRVPGPYGRELRITRADLDAFIGLRRDAGFVWDGATRLVEDLTLRELLEWAERPAVRIASQNWARTASTVTAGMVLHWVREQLQAARSAEANGGRRG